MKNFTKKIIGYAKYTAVILPIMKAINLLNASWTVALFPLALIALLQLALILIMIIRYNRNEKKK